MERELFEDLLSSANEMVSIEKCKACKYNGRVAMDLKEAYKLLELEHEVNYDDNWYSCPKSGECTNDIFPEDVCNCDADEYNVKLKETLKALVKDTYTEGYKVGMKSGTTIRKAIIKEKNDEQH